MIQGRFSAVQPLIAQSTQNLENDVDFLSEFFFNCGNSLGYSRLLQICQLVVECTEIGKPFSHWDGETDAKITLNDLLKKKSFTSSLFFLETVRVVIIAENG